MLHLLDNKKVNFIHIEILVNLLWAVLYIKFKNNTPKLTAYASKRQAARNYSVTELDMCGLAINIASFAHLLKKVDFQCHSRQLSFKAHN